MDFVKLALGHYLGIDTDKLELVRRESGQLILTQPTGVFFSISHSHQHICLACSRQFQVGLDIQFHDSFNSSLFQTICGRRELDKLKNQTASSFFKIWTIKEAALKCVGVGLRFPMHEIDIDFESNELRFLSGENKTRVFEFSEVSLFNNTTTHIVWLAQPNKPNLKVIQL